MPTTRQTRTDSHTVICTTCKRVIAQVDVHVSTNRQGDSNANTMARILRAVRCYDCFKMVPDLLPASEPEDAVASSPLTEEEETARHPVYSEDDSADDDIRDLVRRLDGAINRRGRRSR